MTAARIDTETIPTLFRPVISDINKGRKNTGMKESVNSRFSLEEIRVKK